ncbi:MAG: hypothetical protein EXR98_08545 [Gemmataceae bacterium]|nr:hypothetical protein [Gemmataceae bacterium]
MEEVAVVLCSTVSERDIEGEKMPPRHEESFDGRTYRTVLVNSILKLQESAPSFAGEITKLWSKNNRSFHVIDPWPKLREVLLTDQDSSDKDAAIQFLFDVASVRYSCPPHDLLTIAKDRNARARLAAFTYRAFSSLTGIAEAVIVLEVGMTDFYPQALRALKLLREPAQVAAGERHYIFDPTWGGLTYFGKDRTSTGAVKANRISLDRNLDKAQGDYPFWLFEDLTRRESATLLFRGFNLTGSDELEVALNGKAIPVDALKHIGRGLAEQGRIDFRKAGEPKFATRWFELSPTLVVWGQNNLSVALKKGDPKATGPIVIDEVEVFVQP